jgi:hypothetical protein
MFPFGGGNERLEREFCPYCLRDKGRLSRIGTVRVPNPQYDPDAQPERMGLFVTAPPKEKTDKTVPKKDADGNTVHACAECKQPVPPHLRFDSFDMILMCLVAMGEDKRKESAALVIELLETQKKAMEENPPDGIDRIMSMFGFPRTFYIDENPDEPEAAAAASTEEE